MVKLDTKDEVAILNQGWFNNGSMQIRTDRIDFTDEKLQAAKKENKPYAVDKNGEEMETALDLEALLKSYFDNCSVTPLEDTLFTFDGALKTHCFYDTEKKESVYIQEKYKKLFGAKARFYPTRGSAVVVKVGPIAVGLVMPTRTPCYFTVQEV